MMRRAIERLWYDDGGGIASPLMRALSLVYQGGLDTKRALYGAGLKKTVDAGVPCVSVGNIVVGGTGKTPTAEWLVRELLRRRRKPAVVSRGYGGATVRPARVPPGGGADASRTYGDEPVMLASVFPEVPVIVARDRSEAAAAAASHFGADVVVADDAFQHWRLARRLDLVLVDGRRWFGNGRLLPAGPLREPLRSLERADVVLLTRPERSSEEERISILKGLAPEAVVLPADILPSRWRRWGEAGKADSPGGPWFAFCGIADTGSFRLTLESLGSLAGWKSYGDHQPYSAEEVGRLERAAEGSGAGAAVTTAKDAVRLPRWEAKVPLYVLEVSLHLRDGAGRLGTLLDALAGGSRQ